MSETFLCCCGASCWTRFIGWFQLVGSIITFGILTIALTLVPWGTTVEFSKINMAAILGFSLDFQTNDPETEDNFLFVYLLLTWILNLIAILTAYALLKGSYQKKPKYMLPWIAAKIADTILTVGVEVATCVMFFIERDMGLCAVKIVYYLLLNGTLICIVAIHKIEVENSLRKVRPAIGEIYRI